MKPKQELKAGKWRKEKPQKDTAYWLTRHGLFHLVFCFLSNLRPAAQGITTSIWTGTPTFIINQENTPTEIPTGQSDGGDPSVEGPSS